MTDLWMPGATRLDIGDHAPTDGGPAKAIAHITWDRNATAAKPADLVSYENLRSYFSTGGKSSAPHILWDPFTGRVTQFVPANSRSKSLVDSAGGTRTNRAGSVVLQIEAVFFPYCQVGKTVYPKLTDTPCKGWPELLAWVHSWGVPNTWPMGRPADFAAHRSEATWEAKGGWYAHAHVPENDHQDPGSWPAFTQPQKGSSMTEAQQASMIANTTQIGSLTEKDSKGNRVVHGAGYYLARIEQDTTQLRAEVAALTKLVTALGKSKA